MRISVNKLFGSGLLLAALALPLTWPGTARATAISAPMVTQWEWEADMVVCSPTAVGACEWFNTILISADVDPGDASEYDVFVDFSLTDPGGGGLGVFGLQLSSNGTGDLLGYLEFSGEFPLAVGGPTATWIGEWEGSGAVCVGTQVPFPPICDARSTAQSATFTVVPEPATLTLFGIGLAGLGFMTRRRRRNGVDKANHAS